MKVGYEKINTETHKVEKIIDSTIDSIDDIMTRLAELKTIYADDSSVISVFYAMEKPGSRYKILYVENKVEPE